MHCTVHNQNRSHQARFNKLDELKPIVSSFFCTLFTNFFICHIWDKTKSSHWIIQRHIYIRCTLKCFPNFGRQERNGVTLLVFHKKVPRKFFFKYCWYLWIGHLLLGKHSSILNILYKYDMVRKEVHVGQSIFTRYWLRVCNWPVASTVVPNHIIYIILIFYIPFIFWLKDIKIYSCTP